MGYFPIRYDFRVVIYKRKMFIRSATDLFKKSFTTGELHALNAQDKKCIFNFEASSLVRRTGEVADGKFRIGDIHESGRYNNADDKAVKNAAALALLKRSQSTGDIDDVDDKSNDAPFIDSDHICCQEQPPEFRKIDRSRKFEVANHEERCDDVDYVFDVTEGPEVWKGAARVVQVGELLVRCRDEEGVKICRR